jgi:RES domain-containing protein
MFPVQHLFRIVVPDGVAVEVLDPATLPAGWTTLATPANPLAPPTALQQLGDAWFAARRSAVWLVPSALVPEEPNVLLHPGHPDYAAIRIAYARPFRYDARLAKGR